MSLVYFVTYVPGSYPGETQAQRFLRGALWGDRFTEDLSEFRQIYLRIQVFVGLVMLENNTLVSDSPKLS